MPTQPARTQPPRGRAAGTPDATRVMPQASSRRDGTQARSGRDAAQVRGGRDATPGPGGRDAGRPREARGRRKAQRGGWGGLQGGLGVCIIVASAALGTIATMVTRSAPGPLLGLFVIAGTVAAALAVRPRMGRMILPVPVLAYLVGALTSGIVFNRSAGSSGTALAIGAAQWIANGFFAMTLATVLAVTITAARWLLWRRSRPASREPGWPPADGRAARRAPAARAAWETTAEPGPAARPAGQGRSRADGTGAQEAQGTQGIQGAWGDPGSRGRGRRPERPGTPRSGGPQSGAPRSGGPRPGTGPYNFSSGA
jgi:hypothetical protein